MLNLSPMQYLRKKGTANQPNEMELIEDPVGQDKSHLPSSIPPRIESEIPATENDFIPTHPPSNHQRDNRRLEAGGEGSGEEEDEESAALLGSKQANLFILLS